MQQGYFFMVVILPVLALILLFRLMAARSQTLRGALMMALVAWGVILTGITEFLSLFHTLTLPGLGAAWGLVVIALFAAVYRFGGRIPYRRPDLPVSLWIILISTGIIIALTGIVALLAAPNTWDSMAYHMPRVFFWQQFQSLAPFPAHTNRLIYQPPFAEFVMLHFQILVGSDSLANIGQWAAMLFSAIGVSKIAGQLGANKHGQLLAAVLCVTLPIGIMQATGSKNDFMTALWVVCLAYFVLSSSSASQQFSTSAKDKNAESGNAENDGRMAMRLYSTAFFVGASAGLALLTKGTAYVYLAPLLLWWLVMVVKKYRVEPAKIAANLVLSGVIALAINAGHFLRNMSVYGTPLTAPSHSVYYANETFTPAVLVSNTLRNLALHVYIPDQINERVNIGGAIYDTIAKIHQVLGIDLNDPRTTFPWNEFEIPPIWQIFNEDRAGNPLHLALFFLALLVYPFLRKTRSSTLTIYLLVGIAQFLLFSGLLKWQVWGTRLQLPFFVFIAPFVGVVLAALLNRYLTTLLQIGLLGLALFWIFNTSTRPIFASTDRNPLAIGFYIGSDNINYPSILTQPRLSQYFNAKYELEAPSRAVAAEIKTLNCDTVGLISDESGILYPLMMLLEADNPAVVMQHVNVDNETAFLSDTPPYNAFAPCAIVFMYGAQAHLAENADIDGKSYQRAWTGEGFEIYVPN